MLISNIVIYKTRYVRLHEMDLTTGAREFADIEDDVEEKEAAQHYKSLSLGGKVKHQILNW